MYNVLGQISVTNGKIISVEKGNVARKDIESDKKVCAFSVEVEGAQLPIKALFKGKLAEVVYAAVADGTTIDQVQNLGEISVSLSTRVNFIGDVREVRAKEFVLHNIKDLVFNQISCIGVTNGESPKD